MPPILHPRSRSTSSLFAATMVASFVIVGLPHIFPCPAPRRTLADSQIEMRVDGQQIVKPRRRRKNSDAISGSSDAYPQSRENELSKGATQFTESTAEEVSAFYQMQEEAQSLSRVGRECPVPKPRGVVGQLLGFSNNSSTRTVDQQQTSNCDITRPEKGS